MRFLHTADIHLGYQQYNSADRFDDFARAFLRVVDRAVQEKVDFFLLAGDLFEKRTVDPLAMRQAVAGLQQLHDVGIPVIAVEGNHERAHYHDQYSWLEFLDGIGLITLLDPRIKDGKLYLDPYAPEGGGAFIDLPGGVRVYGLRYYGASTDKALALFQQALSELPGPRPAYSILLTHAGLEGILPRFNGAVSRQALEPLREHINYVGLGHIHKPYQVDDWIYNPGSLETWAIDEAEWADRGYYLVDVATHSPLAHEAQLIASPRRPFVRLRVSVDGCDTPEAVYAAISARLCELPAHFSEPPVADLSLEGSLAFDRMALDLGQIEGMVKGAIAPLLVRLHNNTLPIDVAVNPLRGATRSDLEAQVISELIGRDMRFRAHADEWAEVAIALKQKAALGASPAEILDYLRDAQARLAGMDK